MDLEKAAELLQKYNEGRASVSENKLVENWYENELFAKQVDSSERSNYLKIKHEIWNSIVNEIVPARVAYPWKYLVSAAAAILIIASTTTLLFTHYPQFNKTKSTLSVNSNNILPGQNRAMLTLSDGRKVDLLNVKAGELAMQTGVIIRKSADGQLTYQVQDDENPPKETKYNTIDVPRGGQWQVILPDGSKVYLNALSRLTFPTTFGNNERKVELTGEGYFEVTHDKQKPFRVVTQQQQVEVLGTHFNIMAYPEDKLTKTTLISGSVKIVQGKSKALLQPGQQAQVSDAGIKTTSKVDIEDVAAWKDGYFKFNDNLETIMTKVARWYDVEVIYENSPNPNFRYQGEISRKKSLGELLNMLTYIGNVRFKTEGRRIIVK